MTADAQLSLPTLFVSHGAPDLVIRDIAANRFLRGSVSDWPEPKAILVVSAHFEADVPTLTTDPAPETVYDFGGFDQALRDIVYPAPGAVEVSNQAADLLAAAGFAPRIVETRGFDHGVWTPLHLMYPEADIPVAQLSVSPDAGADWHFRIGQALAPLRQQGVLIVGSGAATHNLEAFFRGGYDVDATPPDWVDAFADWLREKIEQGDTEALIDYRNAPHGADNHPTEEHLMPLYVAIGAATNGSRTPGRRLHTSTDRGVIKMDAFAFGDSPA
ncbi:MAG: class III extradiol ring-cleavage dioxygenase [Pseudomonadota bacterium]